MREINYKNTAILSRASVVSIFEATFTTHFLFIFLFILYSFSRVIPMLLLLGTCVVYQAWWIVKPLLLCPSLKLCANTTLMVHPHNRVTFFWCYSFSSVFRRFSVHKRPTSAQ
eukprot:sb/3477005/